ncbi:hypothetical protein [Cellulomonas uda]|uniref:Nucleoside 2-deoxyribosyltransferase n=1 Tax=Cellulomonas uda TaxID=1714 RepID=A0A4Y3K601_CELUD|nr:hypothetical protein [Cellulomonas uda]NII67802.1 hypothetical protein [Cellulomonas uda]GEA79951.1 hypothetical protein CUD01_03950 [Cellulomonas uda]
MTDPVRRIYVASSWRNPDQPEVVDRLRARGFEVYDFRNPPGRSGFAWSEIDPGWQSWTAAEYIAALEDPLAVAGYASDFAAMQWADTFVLVLPCGRSAHLELGWAVGAGKRAVIITRDGEEPELMAKMVDYIAVGLDDALEYLSRPDAPAPSDEDREALARYREHSVRLNNLSWRIAVAVGDVPVGATEVIGDPDEQLTRLIALATRSPQPAPATPATDAAPSDEDALVERLRGSADAWWSEYDRELRAHEETKTALVAVTAERDALAARSLAARPSQTATTVSAEQVEHIVRRVTP